MERLALLSRSDRAWILRMLSPDARQRLRDHAARERAQLTADTPPPRRAPHESGGSAQTGAAQWAVERLHGQEVAAALAGEPPWIIATLLAQRSWPWEAEVLAHLAPVTRLEVSQLRLAAPRMSDAMAQLLLRTLQERVSSAHAAGTSFEQVLDSAQAAPRGRSPAFGGRP
jgi:hypothetical protein